MKTTIRTQFIISYLFLVLAMILLTNFYGRQAIQDYLFDEAENSMYEAANVINSEYLDEITATRSTTDISFSILRRKFSVFEKMSKTRIWLANESGQILVDSNKTYNKEGNNILQYDSSFFNNLSSKHATLGSLQEEEVLSVIYPLTSNMNTTGYLILMRPVQEIKEQSSFYADIFILLSIFE